MERYIDLHTHSAASDGSMTPAELVRHAKNCGLAAIAITDHDTTDGVEEALAEAEKSGIEVVPGVEISVDYPTEMHILGFFFNGTHINIKPVLESLRRSREERNPKIVGKLKEMGFKIDMDEVEREAGGTIIGRPHIAKVLVRKGYLKSIEEAFDKLLGSGRPAYFKKDKLIPQEGIKQILKAGGIPVLAHPIYLCNDTLELDQIVGELAGYGLKGIEAYYVDNTGEDTANLLRLAIKYNLLVTGGSDFHGHFKTNIEIGTGHGNLRVPYELLKKLKGCCK